MSSGINEAELFEQVREGKAVVNFRKTNNQVFYNPIQEFNRDLSIASINTYSNINGDKKMRILEALAASGIRSMRYALEIDNCSQIIANDFDQHAVELIDKNIELNQVGERVKSSCKDACILMNAQPKNQFDCIDLDPYGSPSAFLDASLRSIRPGGLLLVTATDAGVLCGNGSDACFTKYGSPSLRMPACHEMALRILLQCVNSHAVRHGKYIVPLMSLSIDFYFRLFVMVGEGQMKAKQSFENIGHYLICGDCHSFYELKYGKSIPTNGNCKFVFNTTSSAGFNLNRCENCDGSLKMIGPVWTGKLHDKKFVSGLIEHVTSKNGYKTQDRMLGMLNLAYEELDNPLYHVLDDICSVMHLETPNHNSIRSAVINAGYQVSYSHCNKNSLKTDAPNNVIWDILKKWAEMKPIREKWLKPEHKVFHILQKPAKIQADFTIRNESLPNSKKYKLLRFHEPPPFWGPKSKPKRKNEEDEISIKEKINKPSQSSLEKEADLNNK